MLWIIPKSLIVFPTVYWNFCNISKIMFEIRQMTLVTVWFRFMQVEPWWMLVSPPSLQLVHHSDFRLMTRSQKAIMSLTSRIFETLNHSAVRIHFRDNHSDRFYFCSFHEFWCFNISCFSSVGLLGLFDKPSFVNQRWLCMSFNILK